MKVVPLFPLFHITKNCCCVVCNKDIYLQVKKVMGRSNDIINMCVTRSVVEREMS